MTARARADVGGGWSVKQANTYLYLPKTSLTVQGSENRVKLRGESEEKMRPHFSDSVVKSLLNPSKGRQSGVHG